MNWKKWFLAFVVAAILVQVYDYIVFDRLTAGIANRSGVAFRTDVSQWKLIFTSVVTTLLFTLTYALFAKARGFGLGTGLLFGILVGLIAGWIGNVYNRLLIANFTEALYLAWAAGSCGGYVLMGIVAGLLYKE
jgi:hypothetical protein